MINPVSKTGTVPYLQMSPPVTPGPKTASVDGSFDSVLRGVVQNTVGAVHKAETTAVAGLNGNATVQQVVDQVMAAERALHTTIAIRNKVVAAYQEISRMAI